MQISQPTCSSQRGQEGFVLIAALGITIVIAGIIASMVSRNLTSSRASNANIIEMRLFMAAEAGLNYNFIELERDSLYAVRATTEFEWNPARNSYDSMELVIKTAADSDDIPFSYSLQFLVGNLPVEFANRANPTEDYDMLKVTCTASTGAFRRTVGAWYTLQLDPIFHAAIVSDMIPTSSILSSGKLMAKRGHILLDSEGRTKKFAIHGNLNANGRVLVDTSYATKSLNGDPVDLTPINVSTLLLSYSGEIKPSLAGTEDEVPDFTNFGGSNQLFDFDRYEAAATAGAGQVFTTMSSFASAMNAANDLNQSLEGITVLHVDPLIEGAIPVIDKSGNPNGIPGGINIKGSLVLRFANGTDPLYRIYIATPLRINPADLTSFDATIESSYKTGYPPSLTEAKKPENAAIAPNYSDFTSTEDLTALMFDNGVVDMHDEVNICGVVYAPSFIEIEIRTFTTQYFNGVIIGGGGVFLENRRIDASLIAVRFDKNTVNHLKTMDGKGACWQRIGFITQQ